MNTDPRVEGPAGPGAKPMFCWLQDPDNGYRTPVYVRRNPDLDAGGLVSVTLPGETLGVHVNPAWVHATRAQAHLTYLRASARSIQLLRGEITAMERKRASAIRSMLRAFV